MKIWARVNHVGWVHLWRSLEAFDEAEASAHFFNGRSDPRWQETTLSPEQQAKLAAGEIIELEDPGYFEDEA
jgi:hypothetical protein